jgi:hypothetical protein
MDSVVFNTGTGSAEFALQLEQYSLPNFQTQNPTDVHLYGYLVIPSPSQRGLGRLVRVKTVPSTAIAVVRGSEVGQTVSTNENGTILVVVDKVLSDNVVRVLFETSRHAWALNAGANNRSLIGSNNIRVTVFFAKLAEHKLADSTLVHQSVTMIFCMRAANSPQDQINARVEMTPVPFVY